MKNFNDFKFEQEKQEIATLIYELNIDPEAYDDILNESIFKKAGDWWKKNVTSGNVVRLQSSYDQALKSVDNFMTNMKSLRKQGALGSGGMGGLAKAISDIRGQLTGLKDQVADTQGKRDIAGKSFGDIKNWDGGMGTGFAKKASDVGAGFDKMAGQASAGMADKAHGASKHVGGWKKAFGDWMRSKKGSPTPDSTGSSWDKHDAEVRRKRKEYFDKKGTPDPTFVPGSGVWT